ncbi:bifunctional glutamate N-acetyltransferase/amino-acid acetyltransferase ArgJ [Betaproteobacteria bacterium]|nr:bifunctional glutamate N-acetyltransferase/amino-acid acetyltransferase ArgJ [Betaproteobacteria bacterium]
MTNLLDSLGLNISVTEAGIGIPKRPDLAILNFKKPVYIVGLFTKNKVVASPVKCCKDNLRIHKQPHEIAIVVNSGCANSCTGKQGDETCINVVTYLAKKLKLEFEQVFPFSTGEILKQLPEKKMIQGIDRALERSCGTFEEFAESIMTTDTVRKIASQNLQINGKHYTIRGIAKGSGMISPDMATMLAYVFTDIPIELDDFKELHREVCDDTFNSITVDGEMSTNDSFVGVCAASDESKGVPEMISKSNNYWSVIYQSYKKVCDELASKIVEDGEGATKTVELKVEQAFSSQDADRVARGVANSPLVKTAIFAADPNLGRILSAIGACDISRFDESKISIQINDYVVIQNGSLIKGYDERIAKQRMDKKKIDLRISLGVGTSSRKLMFCDLSYDYVKINAEYRT